MLAVRPSYINVGCSLILGLLWCVGKASSFAIFDLCGWLVQIANVLALAWIFTSFYKY